jgi:predicted unusual protein kinase regulating ubiquinone biosynthesis (AarF/ABC1/UbiB family)
VGPGDKAYPGGRAGFYHVFDNFNDIPLAAALLRQVHQARLRSMGKRVAIKIQSLRLRDIYDKDLAITWKIARLVDSFGRVVWVGWVEQSWEGIFRNAGAILYCKIGYCDEPTTPLVHG